MFIYKRILFLYNYTPLKIYTDKSIKTHTVCVLIDLSVTLPLNNIRTKCGLQWSRVYNGTLGNVTGEKKNITQVYKWVF
jgi:hypothetical protein